MVCLDDLPNTVLHHVLLSLPQRHRAVRLSLALVCRSWQQLVRADEVITVHLSCSPNASAAPALLPSFLHDDRLGCRVRVGVVPGQLPRLGQRLLRVTDLLLLAHRSSVASARLATLRLEDYKPGGLAPVLPGILYHAASLAHLAVPRVRSSCLVECHLVRCSLPANLGALLAHVKRLRVWACSYPSAPHVAALMAGVRAMHLDELCWAIDANDYSTRDDAFATALLTASIPNSGLKHLALMLPTVFLPDATWDCLTCQLEELVICTTQGVQHMNAVTAPADALEEYPLRRLAAALPTLRALSVLQIVHAFDITDLLDGLGGIGALLRALPNLTSLGRIPCDDENPCEWIDDIPSGLRLTHLYIEVDRPNGTATDVEALWQIEPGVPTARACNLQRISHGLATRLPTLQHLFIEFVPNPFHGLDAPAASVAQALAPLRTAAAAGRAVHLLRQDSSCPLLTSADGKLLSTSEATRVLESLLQGPMGPVMGLPAEGRGTGGALSVTVHYEGVKTERSVDKPRWLFEEVAELCPRLRGFAVPGRSVAHAQPATHYPKPF